MQDSKEIKKKAMEILSTAYHGLEFIDWCNQVQEDSSWYNSVQIQQEISKLIKKNPKIQFLNKDKKIIYVHLDLLL